MFPSPSRRSDSRAAGVVKPRKPWDALSERLCSRHGFQWGVGVTRGYVERCVRVWQGRLGLGAWDVRVDWDEPAGEGSNATTHYLNDYDRSTVRFAEDVSGWSREFLNRIVVHELLHLHLRDVDRVVADLDGLLHRDVFDQVDKRYEHESEGLVDRLSYRLVEIGGCV